MTTPVPAASVVVPSFRGAGRLPALLAALDAQVAPAPFEVVVVVDGDVDGSAAAAEAHRGSLDLRVIAFPANRGRVAALNEGFDAARGRLLIRCDDDLEPAAGYVAGHLAAHRGQDRGVVGLYRNVLPDTPYARAYGRAADASLRHHAYASDPRSWWRHWAGNASVTRDVYDEVGPYDPAYRAYGWEDVDWGYRLARTGRPVALVPALETTHRLVATTTAARTARAFSSGAAREVFVTKHGASVLPDPDPGGPWGVLVRAGGRVLTEQRLRAASAAVDRALPALPDAAGHKLVAALVESGNRAGRRIGQVCDPSAV